MSGGKKALLVGINRYPEEGARLRGCVRDVERMGAALATRYGFPEASIRALTDARATRAEILAGLAWLAEGTSAGDVRVFHYSGHGTLVADRNGDEPEGRDECILPVDYERAGRLIDDDLKSIYETFAEGCNLTLVMDCCHSGANQKHRTRPDITFRFSPLPREEELAIAAARRKYRADRDAFVSQAVAQTRDAGVDELRGLIQAMIRKFESRHGQIGNVANREHNLLVAGCAPNQKSAEADMGDGHQGALTYHLLEAIEALGPEATAADVVHDASDRLFEAGFPQIPQLEGRERHKARPLFAPLA